MDARTQLFLSELLWGFDVGSASDLRPRGCPFERWAEKKRLPRTLEELEARELLAVSVQPDLQRVVRLARSGIIAALGGRDPTQAWRRPWDGAWRFLFFDIPRSRKALRARFLRRLRQAHLGRLQYSVWITPDPLPDIRALLGTANVAPQSCLIVEARPIAGDVDRDLVTTAWGFRRINRLYDHYLRYISGTPPRGEALRHWRERENHLWLRAVRADPMLPQCLHPPGYRGPLAFARRRALLLS